MASRSSSTDPAPSDRESGSDASPPGLRKQFGRTRSALSGLVGAHFKLAQAEFSEIVDQLKWVAILAGIAFAALFLAGMTLTVGLILWAGEWAFGSIGWGALHGPELLIGVAALALLAIVDLGWRRGAAALLVAIVFAFAVALIAGANWQHIGDTTYSGLSIPFRPVIVALLWAVLVLAVLCGTLGADLGGARGMAFGIVLGAVAGVIFGVVGVMHPGLRVGIAIGVAVGLLVLPLWAAILVFRHGVDMDKLKNRFMPNETIETTKETIEWVREQLPLGRKS